MRIWKWELAVIDQQIVKMPVGARILDVQMQNDKCCIWAVSDETAVEEPRHIAIYGTGPLIPDDPGRYIATFQIHGGALVFHVFEKEL